MHLTSTITAISTPPGLGGIAIIRVSGPDAIKLCHPIFVPKKRGLTLLEQQPNTVVFGDVINKKGEVLDEVLLSYYRAPHSFTGDDVIEISCHGSVFIQQQVLQLLLSQGCTMAQPGEFTQRAFMNGKLDLSQAEAVGDLIASTTAATHKIALNQMRGGFSNELTKLRLLLLNFVSLIELELDFNEEDVEFANREELKALALDIEQLIANLSDSFNVGNAMKNGIPVAIIGETNVGKSTLLNLLLNEERAIVSDIHGTTRDVIEDSVLLSGITFRFIDTAGIRQTSDTIENLGIERTYQKIEQASIILWLVDCSRLSEHIEWLTEKISSKAGDKKVILVLNKIDKIAEDEREALNTIFEDFEGERVYLSARQKINIDQLKNALVTAAHMPEISQADVVVNNVRHYEALQNAHSSICRVIDGLDTHISGDFLSQDIRECMHFLGEITGQISNDEVLGNIFGKFCIGK